MRLARLVAAGLALGVIAGFAIALLRPRPRVRTADATAMADLTGWDLPGPGTAPVVDVSGGPVAG